MRCTAAKRKIKRMPLKKSILVRLRCQPARPMGTKRTTDEAKIASWAGGSIALVQSMGPLEEIMEGSGCMKRGGMERVGKGE